MPVRRVQIDEGKTPGKWACSHEMSMEEWEADLEHERLKADEPVVSLEEWEVERQRELEDLAELDAEFPDELAFIATFGDAVEAAIDAFYEDLADIETAERINEMGHRLKDESPDAPSLRGSGLHFKEDAETEA